MSDFKCPDCGRTKQNQAIKTRRVCWYCGATMPEKPEPKPLFSVVAEVSHALRP